MFKKIFSRKNTAKAKSTFPPLPVGFKQTITNSLGPNAIPLMPESAERLFHVVMNPDSEALDFVKAIEGDEGLSSRIIKIANSVYFDRGSGSESVVEAVAVIGTKELKNILGANTFSQLFLNNDPLRDQLWEHNLATAIFSRELAIRRLPGKENEAFLGGLLHDIGKLLLLDVDPTGYAKIMKQAGNAGTFCPVEEDVYPFNHCEVGQFIAELWNFSDELKAVIRMHQAPQEMIEREPLILLVKSADLISHRLQLGLKRGAEGLRGYAMEEAPKALQASGFTATQIKEILSEFPLLYEEERERLQIP
ncbi:MAG: HDOD domain-containing protein [Bdellovibrionota bacterium]